MSFPSPILPQEYEEDEVIELSLILKENGLKVRIPRYAGMRINETVIIFMNDRLIKTFEIVTEDFLPRTYLFPDGYYVNVVNEVYYRVIDLAGNRHDSVLKKFTITDASQITFILDTTTGAVANGIAVNQATVLIKRNDAPLNGQSILLTIIGAAVFSNQENTLWITTDQSGEARATFSSLIPETVIIRATFNGQIREKTSSFVLENPWPTLTSVVINNDQPYGEDAIHIQYELRDHLGQGISYTAITLSSSSSTISFGERIIITDTNGKATGLVNSSEPGEFEITASTFASQSISNTTTVKFTDENGFYITAEVVKDGAIANGEDINEIKFYVYYINTQRPVDDQILYVRIDGAVNYQSTIFTFKNGYATLTITSQTPGSFEGLTFLSSDPDISYSFTTTFIDDGIYPIFLGSKNILCKGNMPLNVFLADYHLIAGHNYRIIFERARTSVNNCEGKRVYDKQTDSCVLEHPDSYQFYNDELTYFEVLTSGLGADLYSKRYYYYSEADTGYGIVNVWDYGSQSLSINLINGDENPDMDNIYTQ